jgi:esterase
MLNTFIHGDDSTAPPILIAHGLFGSARNWGVIAKRLSDTRRVLTVDMRNHGDSPGTKATPIPTSPRIWPR